MDNSLAHLIFSILNKRVICTLVVLLIGLQIGSHIDSATAKSINGFTVDDAIIPVKEILSGGPPRDGIPALTEPKFQTVDETNFMAPDDRVIGLILNGAAKAYPVKILNHHELVNDQIGRDHFVVSYCPLCGTGMVFSTNAGQDNWLIFGVSGLLYNSDVLLYDRNTESLWSQIMGQSVSGRLKGIKLVQIPAFHTTYADWVDQYPDTTILSNDTGFKRNYERSPYKGYVRTKRLMFKVSNKAPDDFHPKEQVLGIEVNGHFKAYPFVELGKYGKNRFVDTIADQEIVIIWNKNSRSAYVENLEAETLPSIIGYWFAWFTFHPETDVFISAEH